MAFSLRLAQTAGNGARIAGRRVKNVALKPRTAVVANRCRLSTAAARPASVARVQRSNQQRQSQQKQSSSSSSSNGRSRWSKVGAAAGVAAGVAVALVANEVQADDKVNYDAVKADLTALYDSNMNYDDGSYGPLLVRLAWHSAGSYQKSDNSGGSNGATMRFAPEKNYGGNAGLDVARDLLEPIKKKYPGLSYADLYTLAGALAIEHMGGPQIPWSPGRTDAADGSACEPDGRLPDAAQGQQHVRDIFYRMGFNDEEITALSGAHALGRCHTTRSGFDGPWTRAPTTFSNEYFRLLLNEEWVPRHWNGPFQYENKNGKDLMMLPSDIAMIKDPTFRRHVEAYANDEAKFFRDFASAFGKLLELGVPRGGVGWVANLFFFMPGRK